MIFQQINFRQHRCEAFRPENDEASLQCHYCFEELPICGSKVAEEGSPQICETTRKSSPKPGSTCNQFCILAPLFLYMVAVVLIYVVEYQWLSKKYGNATPKQREVPERFHVLNHALGTQGCICGIYCTPMALLAHIYIHTRWIYTCLQAPNTNAPFPLPCCLQTYRKRYFQKYLWIG